MHLDQYRIVTDHVAGFDRFRSDTVDPSGEIVELVLTLAAHE